MLPLALIMRGLGYRVDGSDRALDQGRLAPKFEYLASKGIGLHPQDGSGLTDKDQVLVTSAAVEDTVPDVRAARALGLVEARRANLLAALFNRTPRRLAIGGTSGKSTTTGMAAWILHATGRAPTVMNGAVMKNFVDAANPYASAITGAGDVFVSEVDESDGSIALYTPTVAVLTNVTLDHKPLAELNRLFGDFVAAADVAVINLDDPHAAALRPRARQALTFSLEGRDADLVGTDIEPGPTWTRFNLWQKQAARPIPCTLQLPGRHNVANALAAIAACIATGMDAAEACAALGTFTGIRRRFDILGHANGVTVIDDFGHNPDKIAATLSTLHAFPGRLLVMFQPHGYGPLRLMGQELIQTFARELGPDDLLVMPEPAYYGGTTSRDVSSEDIVRGVAAAGRRARHRAQRVDCRALLLDEAKPGDRIVIMGARDDTLSDFAAEILSALSA